MDQQQKVQNKNENENTSSLWTANENMNDTYANNKLSNEKNSYFYDLLPNGNLTQTTEFLQHVVNMMFDYIEKTNEREEKILNFMHPKDLKKKLSLEIPTEPLSLDILLNDCHTTMKYAVKTGHPRFFNQLSQGLDLISLAGEWVTATTNTNMFTYEIAPVYNLIEEVVLKKMMSIIGWKEPGDGLFNPGGSISNLYAVQVARHFYFPATKNEGLFNMPKLVIFTSEHSHYSMHRAATILGLGLNQVKYVPVDSKGKLIPKKLESLVEESLRAGEIPFLVGLTAGTTVLGAFDPIEETAEICKKYNMWLHVDAAWGGGALMSKSHKHLLKGIEEADSVTWNPHKLMGALLQASAFMVKKKGLLLSCNEMHASYLFQQDKHYDVCYDTGDKTIQCGRHTDVFKVWLMWRAKGDKGYEMQIDRLFELAQLLYTELEKRDNFEIVLREPEFTNICFWYVPNSLKDLDKASFEYQQKLNNIAPRIKERMMFKGSLMVGYQPLDDKPNFFRAIISNPATNEQDIYFMLDEIECLGRDL